MGQYIVATGAIAVLRITMQLLSTWSEYRDSNGSSSDNNTRRS